MDQAPLSVRRWSRAEYERLVDLGVFRAEPVELIGGQLIVAEPQNSPHATAVGAADDALRAVLPAVLLVLIFQKYMVQGLTAGSVKG